MIKEIVNFVQDLEQKNPKIQLKLVFKKSQD